MAVKFFFADTTISLIERKKLKFFIASLLRKEGKDMNSLNYIFCSDEYLLRINKEFLHHNDYTDIITFCLSGSKEPIIGEIYISTERVKENARLLGVRINEEIHRVIFHGALHLCGFKDKKPLDKKEMRLKEDKYLKLYFD
jgi:rRNA maturation RNase YbeY